MAGDKVAELRARAFGQGLANLRPVRVSWGTSFGASPRGQLPLFCGGAQASKVPRGFLCTARVENQGCLGFREFDFLLNGMGSH